MSKKQDYGHEMVSAPHTVHQAMELAGEMTRRMMNGQASIGEAKAVGGLLNTQLAALHLRQEQAKMTGMQVHGDQLPDLKFAPCATPQRTVIDMPPAVKSLKGKKAKAA